MALTDKSSIVIPKGFYGKANVLQGFNPQTENLVDLDVVRNTTATRVNEQGLIESVAANVPRRDFLNGGCGELLVEPQRTNLITYSEEFDNADWDLFDVSLVANQASSPSGGISADKIIPDAVNSKHILLQTPTTGQGTFTLSCFAKADGYDFIAIGPFGTSFSPITTNRAYFNLQTGTKGTEVGNIDSSKIENYGNGWYRCSVTVTTVNDCEMQLFVANADNSDTFTGNGVDGVLLWGAQLEEGTYPTSYIPTTASAVTRNQDVISATNIGSLLGDSEGGIFAELSYFDSSSSGYIEISSGLSDDRVIIFATSLGAPKLFVDSNNVNQANIVGTEIANNEITRFAGRYSTNDFAFAQNGVIQGIDTVGITFTNNTLNRINFNSVAGNVPFYGRIRQLVVFDNAPTDSELQTLTTP